MQALQEASPHTHALVLSPRTLADALQDILRVGCAADVEAEALQLVDSLQARLRRVVGLVAKAKRPKVLSLEGLEPLVLGMLTSLGAELVVTCVCPCSAVCARCKGCFCCCCCCCVRAGNVMLCCELWVANCSKACMACSASTAATAVLLLCTSMIMILAEHTVCCALVQQIPKDAPQLWPCKTLSKSSVCCLLQVGNGCQT